MFLKLGPDEGVEIVSIKVGFGSFGEVFHRSGGGIGADFVTGSSIFGSKCCFASILPGVSDCAFTAKRAISKVAVVARTSWCTARIRLFILNRTVFPRLLFTRSRLVGSGA